MNVQNLLERPEYTFLKQLDHPILFLTLGGSHAYGTNNENSDIDVRGCFLNRPEELLGLRQFEVFADKKRIPFFIASISSYPFLPVVIQIRSNC